MPFFTSRDHNTGATLFGIGNGLGFGYPSDESSSDEMLILTVVDCSGDCADCPFATSPAHTKQAMTVTTTDQPTIRQRLTAWTYKLIHKIDNSLTRAEVDLKELARTDPDRYAALIAMRAFI